MNLSISPCSFVNFGFMYSIAMRLHLFPYTKIAAFVKSIYLSFVLTAQ